MEGARFLRRVIPVLAALLLAGCSTGVRIAYNNLDTLANWEVSDYVDFQPAQKAVYKSSFKTLWDWHRETQLPAYAADLREAAALLEQGPLSREAAAAWITRIEKHGETLGKKAQPPAERLIVMLDDAQVDHMIAVQKKKLEKEAHEHDDDTPDKRHKRFMKEFSKTVEPWIGDLTPAQKDILERSWLSRQKTPQSTPEHQLQSQLADLQKFADLLATRRQPGFDERLSKFGDDDADRNSEEGKADAAETERRRQVMLDLLSSLDVTQRTKLRGRLVEISEDFEALSRQAAKQNRDAKPPASEAGRST